MSKCSQSQTNLVSNLDADSMVGWLTAPEGVHPKSWDMAKGILQCDKDSDLEVGRFGGWAQFNPMSISKQRTFPSCDKSQETWDRKRRRPLKHQKDSICCSCLWRRRKAGHESRKPGRALNWQTTKKQRFHIYTHKELNSNNPNEQQKQTNKPFPKASREKCSFTNTWILAWVFQHTEQ